MTRPADTEPSAEAWELLHKIIGECGLAGSCLGRPCACATALDRFRAAGVREALSTLRVTVEESSAFDNFECGYGITLGECPESNSCIECVAFKMTRGASP